MAGRRGEKIGWIAGWLGGFIWIAVLSIIFLVQGKSVEGIIGLVLTALAVVGVLVLAPWRHPSTSYWKLMIPLYMVFFTSAAWAISSFGGYRKSGLGWMQLALVFPLLTPLGAVGRRKWVEKHKPGPSEK